MLIPNRGKWILLLSAAYLLGVCTALMWLYVKPISPATASEHADIPAALQAPGGTDQPRDENTPEAAPADTSAMLPVVANWLFRPI